MIAGRRGGADLRSLRALFTLGAAGSLTDGQLLERFVGGEGETSQSAFAALVERHGALVWRTCLAVLRDEHEAEDAFQAVFLVLALKARSLRVGGSLGPWLHRVACHTAAGLRTSASRRREHERRRARRDADPIEAGAPHDPDRDAAIHEELAGLPEKYRGPLVLCDLQGRSHQEAARELGWPVGTVKSRQSRARRLLRDRLARRGVGPAVAGLAVVPSRVTAAAVRQAALLATGIGTSSHILSLAQGALRIMLWSKLRTLGTAALTIGIAFGGAGAYVRGFRASASDDGVPGATTRKDPEAYRAALEAQRLAVRKARAIYEIARQNRMLAEIALEEQERVIHPRELATAEGRIKLAESDLKRADDRLAWASRMSERKYVSAAQKAAEERNAERARFALQEARMFRKTLEDHDGAKTVEGLQLGIDKARAEERAEQAALDRERAREADLERRLREAE